MMRKLLLIALMGALCLGVSHAQNFESEGLEHLHENTRWYQMLQEPNVNYFEVTKAYDNYFKTHPFQKSLETRYFQKWNRRVINQFDAKGNITTPPSSFNDLRIMQKARIAFKSTGSKWNVIGPDKWDLEATMASAHPTQGVFRSVTEHPTNPSLVWAGSISSGLWHSTDGGDNWKNVTNHLLIKSVRGVAISKSNDQIAYAATNAGVIKSTNGGTVWEFTNLDWREDFPKGAGPMQMLVNPNNPDSAIYAGSNGIYLTADGGANWRRAFSRQCWDVEFHPSNPKIIYASVISPTNNPHIIKWCEFWRSEDGGNTWTQITTGIPVQKDGETMKRIVIAVTPAAPNVVYAFAGGSKKIGDENIGGVYGIFKSTDAGLSFGHVCCGAEGVEPGSTESPNLLDYAESGLGKGAGQYTWDMDLAVSDTDPNFLLAAGISVWKSTNGGANWNLVKRGNPKDSPKWYHYDVQSLHIYGNRVWITSDGGVSLSKDRCETIATKNNGIIAHEIWGFDQGWKSNIMAIGLYHGPVKIRDDETYDGWHISSGADASTVMINKGDDRFIYAHPWGDVKITRSNDKNVPPKIVDLGAKLLTFIHPVEFFDHRYYNTFYTIDEYQLKKTDDNAGNWKVMETFSERPFRIATSYSKHNTVYIIRNWVKIEKSIDGGKNWTNITPGNDITKGKAFSNITVDGENDQIVWVTMKDKQDKVKVLKSTDGGTTWIDYSGPANNLPSYPLNVIAHQIGTDGGVYIGGAGGVWYRNNSMDKWQLYSTELPKGIEVWFIRINYALQKIRIGTLSGIWEAPLFEASKTIAQPMAPAYRVPINQPVRFADHSVCLKDATFKWEFPGGEPSESTDEFPEITYTELGKYNVKLTVTDSNGTSSELVENMIETYKYTPPIDRSKWKVVYTDSEETVGENGRKENVLDNNPSTIWHTEWSQKTDDYPHEIQVDMGKSYDLKAFSILPRQNSSNGRIKNFEFYISDDRTKWGSPVRRGSWSNTTGEKKQTFETKRGRYFRLLALSEVNNNKWASLAEIKAWGEESQTNTSVPNTELNNDEIAIYSRNNQVLVHNKTGQPVSITVFDQLGRAISSDKYKGDHQEIIFTKIIKGIYIFKIQTEKQRISKKIIVY
ncbi:PKD domain-containing protein [Prolixibacteraceae bacterium JC049]|nr:PKD domain-containing protein [Prolixibacteraceae bacterium JC049]